MSYYTKLSVVSPAPNELDLSGSLDAVRSLLDEYGISHDVLAQLTAVFASGTGKLRVFPSHALAVLELVSKRHPETKLVVRGQGEDEETAWAFTWLAGVRTNAKATGQAVTKAASAAARAAVAAIPADAPATAYSPKTSYSSGAVIEHASFGKGVVTQVLPAKIVVQFSDAIRTLVHGRP